MRNKVFISYRRKDAKGVAPLLASKLKEEFGQDAIFLDTYSIGGGENFHDRLMRELEQARVVLVVIGDDWDKCLDDARQRRIDDSRDWVHVEVFTALSDDAIHVIPILVDGAKMPPASDLPDKLVRLTQRNPMPFATEMFVRDARNIADRIETLGIERVARTQSTSRSGVSAVINSSSTNAISASPETASVAFERRIPRWRRVVPYWPALVGLVAIGLAFLVRPWNKPSPRSRRAPQPATTTVPDASSRSVDPNAAGAGRAAYELGRVPTLSADGASTSVPANRLRIATWNLEWLHRDTDSGPVPRSGDDYERLQKYALRLGADIAAVQEVYSEEALAKIFPGKRYKYHLSEHPVGQRTGFAYRSGLSITRYPDYTALSPNGQLRAGADIGVRFGTTDLRLLSVHLKAGCASGSLEKPQRDCATLNDQLLRLGEWADARRREGTAFAIIGDFNYRFFDGKGDGWHKLNPAHPRNALWSPTDGRKDQCSQGFTSFIDHMAFDPAARALTIDGSFSEMVFDAEDEDHRRGLSDHCPIFIDLESTPVKIAGNAKGVAMANPGFPRAALAQPVLPKPKSPIKGNINGGDKIYHLSTCPDYTRVRIEPKDGERYFDSEAAAQAAGWRRASNCR